LPPELVVHEAPLSGVAEAARSIRTNIMFMNPDRPYKRLLVSSAAPSEGKTTVACSIAIALAQGGQRVCIVDCDLGGRACTVSSGGPATRA
jgi:succinoglycan biosynthesis transport protein ExoP